MKKNIIKNILIIVVIVGVVVTLVLTGNIRVEKPANNDADAESTKEPYDSLYVDEEDIDLEVEEELQDEEDFEVEEDLEKPRKELTEEEELILYLNQFALLNSTETNVLEDKTAFLKSVFDLIMHTVSEDNWKNILDKKGETDNYIRSFYYGKRVDALIKDLRSVNEFSGYLYRYDSQKGTYEPADSFGECGYSGAKVTKIESIKKENDVYNITFTYDYGEDCELYIRDEDPEEYKKNYDGTGISTYRRTIKIKKNKDSKYSKYKIISLNRATQLGNKDDKIKIIYNDTNNYYRTIKSVIIDGKDITNKIHYLNSKYVPYTISIKEENDFIILNIIVFQDTPREYYYSLYVFDYSGSLLFKLTNDDNDNYIYYGQYKYEQNKKSITFFKVRNCEQQGHADYVYYSIPELGINKETNTYMHSIEELKELGKEKYGKINWGVIYEITYLPSKKFSDIIVSEEIKFNNEIIKKYECVDQYEGLE